MTPFLFLVGFKKIKMRVYSLGFSVKDNVVIDAGVPSSSRYLTDTFTGQSLASWSKPSFFSSSDVFEIKDFIGGLTGAMCFLTERAAMALNKLSPSGFELIEVSLQDRVGRFFALNVTAVVDCLDKEKSNILYSKDDPGRVLILRQPHFREKSIPNTAAFKVPEFRGRFFVTNKFVNVVLENRLTGVSFQDPSVEVFGK